MQICLAMRRVARIAVPSARDGGCYEVTVINGVVACGCPGWMFRGRCHHVAVEEQACGWGADLPGAEPQTDGQQAARVCPRCGGRTGEAVGGLTQHPITGDPGTGGGGGRER